MTRLLRPHSRSIRFFLPVDEGWWFAARTWCRTDAIKILGEEHDITQVNHAVDVEVSRFIWSGWVAKHEIKIDQECEIIVRHLSIAVSIPAD